MPFGDKTGPAGLGPRTGRGAGFCAGFGGPGFLNRPGSYGFFGGGRAGGGRGWRNRFYATGLTGWQRAFGWFWGAPGPFGLPSTAPSRDEQLSALKEQAEYLESALATIRKRVETLEGKSNSE